MVVHQTGERQTPKKNIDVHKHLGGGDGTPAKQTDVETKKHPIKGGPAASPARLYDYVSKDGIGGSQEFSQCPADTNLIQQRKAILVHEIGAFQAAWAAQNGGSRPDTADYKNHPEIAAKIRELQKLRKAEERACGDGGNIPTHPVTNEENRKVAKSEKGCGCEGCTVM